MTGFIEIIDRNDKSKRQRLINIQHIEEVVKIDEKSSCIYFAFACPDSVEQDYYEVDIPYEKLKREIHKATVLACGVKVVNNDNETT